MKYRRLFRLGQPPIEKEIDEEIASHIEIRTEQLVRAGETPERAREIVLARFGNVEEARRNLYATSRQSRVRRGRMEMVNAIARDARLVWRQSARAPLATALTILTLVLAIGLTTAMFAIVDHVLIRPLPYLAPERLVFFESVDSVRKPIGVISSDNWLDLRGRNRTLESTAIYKSFDTSVNVSGSALRVPLELVSPEFFDVLRAPMVLGRGFAANGAAPERAAVVSESFWRRHLNAASDGSAAITVQGSPYAVIGVVKAGAEYPRGTQVWLPFEPRFVGGAARNNVNYEAIARLRPSATMEAAQSDLASIALSIQAAEPISRYTHGVNIEPLREHVVQGSKAYLRILMGAVAFVLLVACANIAGVNFARARTRQQEVSIRMALGAGRRRVMAQLLTEQVVLSLIGGAGGIALAWYVVRAISGRAADLLPRAAEIAIDGRVVLFALIVSLLAGLLSALAPTWRASGAAPRELIGARGVVKGGNRTTGAAVVAIEIAAAIVLLCGGALLLRSFGSLISRDLGFDPDRIVTAQVILDSPSYAPPATSAERIARFWEELAARTRALPDVETATLATVIPTSTVGPGFIQVEGLDDRNAGAGYHVVDGAYFEALRIPLRAGRAFNESDRAGGPRGVVVNESFAAK
jgi:predicted permease